MKKLIEGQKLWWVPQRNRHAHEKEVTVLKVGRKWAQLDNHERIDLETLVADAGQYTPSGCCYLSREEYEQAEALTQAWSKLKRDLQYGRTPDGVTIGDIEAARQLLGLPSNQALSGELAGISDNSWHALGIDRDRLKPLLDFVLHHDTARLRRECNALIAEMTKDNPQ